MIKRILCLLLLLPWFSFSQKTGPERIAPFLASLPKMSEDTIKVRALNELSGAYQYTDPQKGLHYGRMALRLAQKLEWDDGTATAYKNIGVNYFTLSDFALALTNYNHGLKASSNKKTTANLLSNISLVYTYQSNYARGLKYAFQSLKIRETIHDEPGIAVSCSNIGMLYYNLGDTNTAIKYYEKAIRANEITNNEVGLTRILYNLGLAYSGIHQNPKAIDCFGRGIKIAEKLGDTPIKAQYLSAIADVWLDEKNYKMALEYCSESIALTNSTTKDENNIAYCSGIAAEVYFEMAKEKNNDAALLGRSKINFEKALAIHKNLNALKLISYDYSRLSEIASMTGDDKRALVLYKNGISYKDSVFNADNKETIKNLEDQRTIELRTKEIKISKLKLEGKEKQKWYFIFGLGLLAIIVGLLFYQSNNRRKTNRKLNAMNNDLDQANKVKTRLLSILNHDLRSPVNSFIHYIQLQKENPELLDDASKNRIENATLSSAKNLLHSMEDILLWTKDQMENFEPQPKTIRVDSLFDDTKNHFSAVEKVRFSFECDKNLTVFTDDNYLKTIIRNLTANAIHAVKETPDPMILWKAWRENNRTFLLISDNGSGATQEQLRTLYDDKEMTGIQSGLGLHLVRDLAKAIHCTIAVDSKPDRGTTFILSLA